MKKKRKTARGFSRYRSHFALFPLWPKRESMFGQVFSHTPGGGGGGGGACTLTNTV